MKRKVISIDENICNGCGSCVEGCYEGAIQYSDWHTRRYTIKMNGFEKGASNG